MTWKVKEFIGQKQLVLQLLFFDPITVSPFNQQDRVIIRFLNQTIFFSAELGRTLHTRKV